MHIDWLNPTWSYLLGVVHGDGTVSPWSISVSVGYRDQDYAEILAQLWSSLGFSPKIYRPRSAMRIDVHNRALRDKFAEFKAHGKWSWPSLLSWPDYIAGVIDTDGCVTLNKSIIITLKRSGNLHRLAKQINQMGIRAVAAKPTTSTFSGAAYETETITITGMDRIVTLCQHITLRHPRKSQRLAEMLQRISDIQSHVPLYQRVAEWLREEPRTWKEIADHFSITKTQVESVLCQLRPTGRLEVIPPPEALSRYRMRGQ